MMSPARTAPGLGPADIGSVQRALVEHLDLLPRPTWQRKIPGAVDAACRKLGLERGALLGALADDSALAEAVASHLMVGETYFFRHPDHFDTAADYLRRLAETSQQRSLRVWCAGCASGEEPFSLLLRLHALMPEIEERVEILGTDLDPGAIHAAEMAAYSSWSFRKPAPDWAGRYLSPSAVRGRVTLPPALRRRVRFRCEPILRTLEKSPPNCFDVIFFRNVGIYLGETAREQIFSEFSRVLRADGRLVVAPADPRPGRVHFERLDGVSTCWYRPASSPAKPSATPRPPLAAGPKKRERGKALRSAARPERAVRRAENPSGDELVDRAQQLADRGDLGRAIALLRETEPAGCRALRLRGSLLLAADRLEDALSDFRAVLYRRPGDLLCRWWMSMVLLRLDRGPRALAQLRGLRRSLSELPATERLDDGTSAGELLRAVDQRIEDLS